MRRSLAGIMAALAASVAVPPSSADDGVVHYFRSGDGSRVEIYGPIGPEQHLLAFNGETTASLALGDYSIKIRDGVVYRGAAFVEAVDTWDEGLLHGAHNPRLLQVGPTATRLPMPLPTAGGSAWIVPGVGSSHGSVTVRIPGVGNWEAGVVSGNCDPCSESFSVNVIPGLPVTHSLSVFGYPIYKCSWSPTPTPTPMPTASASAVPTDFPTATPKPPTPTPTATPFPTVAPTGTPASPTATPEPTGKPTPFPPSPTVSPTPDSDPSVEEIIALLLAPSERPELPGPDGVWDAADVVAAIPPTLSRRDSSGGASSYGPCGSRTEQRGGFYGCYPYDQSVAWSVTCTVPAYSPAP